MQERVHHLPSSSSSSSFSSSSFSSSSPQDVNEQNQWVSAIRKACLTNRDMSPVYHTGVFKKSKWSCCRTSASQGVCVCVCVCVWSRVHVVNMQVGVLTCVANSGFSACTIVVLFIGKCLLVWQFVMVTLMKSQNCDFLLDQQSFCSILMCTILIFEQFEVYHYLQTSSHQFPLSPVEPGCSQCHRGITIGDWRDPLDPDLDAQVIFSQFQQGRNALRKKYLPGLSMLVSFLNVGGLVAGWIVSLTHLMLYPQSHIY